MIPITKPFLPPQSEYQKYLDQIWESNWLTNRGPLAERLEDKLQKRLQSPKPLFVTNGTIALQLGIRALQLKGEVITTPFSFVATTSSIVWESCRPVFVDIDEKTLNIDPAKIEAAITAQTTGILATHVYGNPCEVEAIQKIADKHNLKVIYDGAHTFGVELNGQSIFNYGDLSICSLHATKLYHSGEGGLVFTKNDALREKVFFMRNFGFNGPENFAELGINGKNSEFHAAMGLANLNHIGVIHQKRKELSLTYDQQLKNLSHRKPEWHPDASVNYAYYPIILDSEEALLTIKAALEANQIFPRRYFYPSLAKVLPYLPETHMPITEDIAQRILCLPLYYDLSREEVFKICEVINSI